MNNKDNASRDNCVHDRHFVPLEAMAAISGLAVNWNICLIEFTLFLIPHVARNSLYTDVMIVESSSKV